MMISLLETFYQFETYATVIHPNACLAFSQEQCKQGGKTVILPPLLKCCATHGPALAVRWWDDY